MTYYDRVYERAVDNYGLITTAEARTLGVPSIDLVKMARRGKLYRVGHGVYRLTRYVPTEFDKYAEAVTLVGEGSYVYGESVLAMFDLAFVNPRRITVATPARVRKALPTYIEVVSAKADTEVTQYEGVPSQSVADAFRTSRRTVMTERLLPAVEDARRQGLVSEREAKELKKEIKGGRKNAKQQA
ncbi:MAG: type IV toxin-antitoxin system AbiEi family antitoxin domain-containing protein [Coriobacteriia bacterium]